MANLHCQYNIFGGMGGANSAARNAPLMWSDARIGYECSYLYKLIHALSRVSTT